MSTDIKEVTDTFEQVAFGAAETAAQIASDPIGTVRKQVKGLERKGTPTARRVNRRINYATAPAKDAFKSIGKTAETVRESAGRVAVGLAPDKVVIRGLRLVKVQAKRPDMVGDVAKRTLRFFNRSFKTVARMATRFENASELTPVSRPATRPVTRPAATRRSTRRTRRRAA